MSQKSMLKPIRNMKLAIITSICALLFLSAKVFASQLLPTNLSEVHKESELVVIAQVIKVTPVEPLNRKDKPYDGVTLKIETVVKGTLKETEIKIITEPRGVRDFDPSLKVGQNGVFFLCDSEKFGYRLTKSGAVAIFTRGNFTLTKPR